MDGKMNDAYFRMLAMRQLMGMNNMYMPPPMKYVGVKNEQPQQNQSNMNYTDIYKYLSKFGSTPTGMTPNATNPMGESFYGWGAQTGDWGAGASVPFDGSQYAGSGIGGGATPSPTGGPFGSGLGATGYGGIIAAAIMAQHMMSKNTDRRFEGQKTKDAFGGSFGTEPWLAFSMQKLGLDAPTAGEKFDAAVQNKDWDLALKRSPAMLQRWLEPGTTDLYDASQSSKLGDAGKWGGRALFPLQWFYDWIGRD